jgi:RNA polymerase sigma-70 factor (ECF subfamily)
MDSDEQLIVSYLKGDGDSLNILIKRYSDYIYNFIYQYVKNRELAEDLTQEVFIKVWKNFKKFDPKKKFKVWLFQIARNTTIDFFRKKKEINFSELEREGEEFDIPDTGPIPSEIFEKKEIQAEVKKALEALPLIYRSTLIFYYQNQFNLREIAEIRGEPVDTIKSRYRRALVLLQKQLLESSHPNSDIKRIQDNG